VEGQATPQSPVGMGDNPGRLMYVDREKTKAKYIRGRRPASSGRR
jgi:hypothetical protein